MSVELIIALFIWHLIQVHVAHSVFLHNFTCTLKKIGPCLPVTNGAAGNNTSHVSVWLASHFFGVDNIPSSKVLGLKAPSSF